MSDKPKTAAEWLALGDELPRKLAEVLTPGGRTHGHVLSPDLIVLDWNTAMEWRDKIKDAPASRQEIVLFMQDIANYTIENSIKSIQSLYSWWQWNAQPKDWLILIALAEGAKT